MPNDHSSSNPVLQRLESWIERKKTRTNCPHLRQYPHPGYACDFQQDCESCLIVAAALELRKVTSAHETTECHIRPHDFCSAGTCKVCLDAARYRVVRASRLTGEVLAHELDAACDALLRARASSVKASAQDDDDCFESH